MAGGIDWFRWHHGSVTDPKFQLVARKAGVRLPDVLAVWAFLLEKASASDERGNFGEIDCEAVDCLFGLDDGQTSLILGHMGARGLVDGGRITAWEKRQPKRERDADNSTDRTRAYRERQRQHGDAQQDHVTPCDATERQETPRGDKRREEKKDISPEVVPTSGPVSGFAVPLVDGSDFDVPQRMLDDWATLFPAVDVQQELREMRAWSLANKAKRKTRRGVEAFIVRWLSKAQDTPGRPRAVAAVDDQRSSMFAGCI